MHPRDIVEDVAISFGGLFTGGSKSARPIATDEITKTAFNWIGSIVGSFRSWINVWQSDDAAITRVLIPTNDFKGGFMLFEEIDTIVDSWSEKEIFMIHGSGNGLYASSWMVDYTSTATRLIKGVAGATVFDVYLSTPAFTYPGYTDVRNYITQADQYRAASNDLDLSTTAYSVFPIGVFSATAGATGFLGILSDMWVGLGNTSAGPALDRGITFPDDSANRQLVQCGNIVLPWTGDSTVPQMQTTPSTATADAIFGGYLDTSGVSITTYYQMQAVDSGAPVGLRPYHHGWTVTGTPDTDGSQTTAPYGGPLTQIAVVSTWNE